MTDRATETFKRWLITATLVVVSGILSACSRPNPNPETLDPIYADLQSRAALAKGAAESAKEETKKLREELEKLPARDITRRKTQENISKQETRVMAAEQEALYFEIRAEQRKKYARDEYMKAFDKGKPWPNPEDFEAYKLQRKLQDSPREWSSKVQKTDRYNRKSPEDMRKELEEKLKGAGPAGGGGH